MGEVVLLTLALVIELVDSLKKNKEHHLRTQLIVVAWTEGSLRIT